MSITFLKRLQKASFWLAVLFHLLLFILFTVNLHFYPEEQETPNLFIPSYTSQDIVKPVVTQQQVAQKTSESKIEKEVIEKKDTLSLAKPRSSKSRSAENPEKYEKATPAEAIDGVHLIGKKKLDDPLIKLLGQALGRHLIYPRVALEFNLRGTAYVGFYIRPDGIVTGVKLMQSSNAGVLDEEALRAIKMISPVREVGEYVKEPRFLVVGIIFG
jgi:TonB family protein